MIEARLHIEEMLRNADDREEYEMFLRREELPMVPMYDLQWSAWMVKVGHAARWIYSTGCFLNDKGRSTMNACLADVDPSQWKSGQPGTMTAIS